MKRILYTITTLFFFSIFSFANDDSTIRKPDDVLKLEKQLIISSGIEKLKIYNQLIQFYNEIRFEKEFIKFKTYAEDYISNNKFDTLSPEVLYCFGVHNYFKKDLQKAIENFQKAQLGFKNKNNKINLAKTLYFLGRTYGLIGLKYWNDIRYNENRFDNNQKSAWREHLINNTTKGIENLNESILLWNEIVKSDPNNLTNVKEKAGANFELGKVYWALQDYNTGLKYYYISRDIYDSIEDELGRIYILSRIGEFYRSDIHDYNKAIQITTSALNALKELPLNELDLREASLLKHCFGTIGFSYYSLSEFQNALDYYLRMLDIKLKMYGRVESADNYNYVGRAYYELNKYDKALKYYTIALNLSKEKNIPERIAQSEYNLGLLYFRMGDYETSLLHHSTSLDYRKKIGRNISIYSSLNKIGIIYQITNKYPAAEKYFHQALQVAMEMKEGHFIEESYLLLSHHFELTKDYPSSLEYFKKSKVIGDSLTQQEKSKELLESQVRYEILSKEKEIIRNKQKEIEKARQNSLFIGISGVSLILVIILVFIIFYQRYRAKIARNWLFSEQKALRSQMNPHFIFNSLGSIQNFILKQDSDSANNYLAKFASLIRQVLDNSKYNTISLQQELETLKNYIYLEQLRFIQKFDYSIDVDQKINTSIVEIPPMLIQPFLENAILHGLSPLEKNGKLRLSFLLTSLNRICITIEDNGIGRRASAEINKSRIQHRSTGSLNITDRIKLFNRLYRTDFTVKIIDLYNAHGSSDGTKVEIEFPMVE